MLHCGGRRFAAGSETLSLDPTQRSPAGPSVRERSLPCQLHAQALHPDRPFATELRSLSNNGLGGFILTSELASGGQRRPDHAYSRPAPADAGRASLCLDWALSWSLLRLACVWEERSIAGWDWSRPLPCDQLGGLGSSAEWASLLLIRTTVSNLDYV